MASKTTYFLYFLLHIIAWFLVSAWFWVDNQQYVFRSKWPMFDSQVQNGYHQHTNKSGMHVNYDIINNICLHILT